MEAQKVILVVVGLLLMGEAILQIDPKWMWVYLFNSGLFFALSMAIK